jgi:hypothetical protein
MSKASKNEALTMVRWVVAPCLGVREDRVAGHMLLPEADFRKIASGLKKRGVHVSLCAGMTVGALASLIVKGGRKQSRP